MLSYPTLSDAVAAGTVVEMALVNQKFSTPEEVQAGWVIVGYGLSVGVGSPPVVMSHEAVAGHLKAAVHDHALGIVASSIPWKSIAILILKLILASQGG